MAFSFFPLSSFLPFIFQYISFNDLFRFSCFDQTESFKHRFIISAFFSFFLSFLDADISTKLWRRRRFATPRDWDLCGLSQRRVISCCARVCRVQLFNGQNAQITATQSWFSVTFKFLRFYTDKWRHLVVFSFFITVIENKLGRELEIDQN